MEKRPRKKQKRILPPAAVLLALLGCIAAAAGGLFFLSRGSAPLPPAEREAAVMLFPRGTDDISSIYVAPKDGEPYLLERGESGFFLSGREGEALRATALDDLMMTAGELPAESVLLADINGETSVSPRDFGLDPAQSTATITYLDGEEKTLLLGEKTPNEEKIQQYCMLEGDSRLFSVLWDDGAVFLRDKAYYLDFEQPRLDGSLLDRIEVTGDVSWTLHYTPSGWYMDAPFAYPLSTVKMDALLKKIEAMGFEMYLGEAEETGLEAFGLDRPAVQVRLAQAPTVITGETAEGESVSLPVPEKTYALALGKEAGGSGLYVEWEGKVFKASSFLLGFWKELKPEAYLLRSPVNFLVNNLDAVTLWLGDTSSSYRLQMVESVTPNNQIAVDEYGRVLYDCAVRRAGEDQDMDAERFLDWYTALAALTDDGELPRDFTLTGESRGGIILENDHLTRTIEFYPFDALHDALAVDGVARFYVRKSWLDGAAPGP